MSLVRTSDFLAVSEVHYVTSRLDDPTLLWGLSSELGRTGVGNVEQLASREMHSHPAMCSVAQLLASRVYEAARVHFADVPGEDQVTPQVFPVRMRGDRQDPPHQSPHHDAAGGRHPRIVGVFYPRVIDCVGGELLVMSPDGRVSHRVTPATNLLVAMPGDTLHAVAPLMSGERTTVVVNLYW